MVAQEKERLSMHPISKPRSFTRYMPFVKFRILLITGAGGVITSFAFHHYVMLGVLFLGLTFVAFAYECCHWYCQRLNLNPGMIVIYTGICMCRERHIPLWRAE